MNYFIEKYLENKNMSIEELFESLIVTKSIEKYRKLSNLLFSTLLLFLMDQGL